MATYEITAPDGNTYEVTAPDGASEKDVLEYAKRSFAGPKPTAAAPAAPASPAMPSKPASNKEPLDEYLEHVASDPLVRGAVGAGKPVIGLGQLLARGSQNLPNPFYNVIGRLLSPGMDEAARNVTQMEKMGREGMRARGDEGMNVAGMVGEVLSPVGLGMTKAIPIAKTALPRIAQAAGAGGLFSLMQPYVEKDGSFNMDKLADAAIGATLGAGIGGTTELARYGGKIVSEFFTKAGAKDVSLRYLDTIMGEGGTQKLIDAVEKRLASGRNSLVPAYKPTTAELAADVPEASPFLALQVKLSETVGGPSGRFGAVKASNRDALRNAIGTIAGTDDDLAAALRKANYGAERNYGPLMGRTVSPESDATMLLRDLQATRGIPQWQPSGGSGPFVGKAGALQQWGKAATDAAQQQRFADTWMPVPGMPRVAGRYSPNIERVPEARAAAQEALELAGVKGKEADFLQAMLDRMERAGVGAKQGLTDLYSRPSMAHALAYAQKLATEKGRSFPGSLSDDFSVQNIHDIKLGLDDAIRRGSARDPVTGATAADNNTLAAMARTKDEFLSWVKTKVPEYDKARMQYAEDMVPVNQMRVGQALLDKLQASPQGTETPGSFLRALKDETKLIKTATGQPRQELGQVLTKNQEALVDEVGGILERKLQSLSPVQKSTLPGGGIDEQIGVKLPSILSRPVVIANWLLSTMHKGRSPVEKRADDILTFWSLNPDKFVEAVKTMRAADQRKLSSMMSKAGVDPVRQGIVSPAVFMVSGEVD